MGQLDGRNAIVTGGSRGIGRAIVARFVAAGARVLFTYKENEAAATEVANAAREQPAEGLELLRTMSPLGRLGTPEEVAAVVAFVAGPDGGWLTGQNVNASGGV